ncbi:MAG TPA: HD domain-containing phosphohydrolase [Candidatus Eisenbacteria bacterium]|jgi:putative nucleotidyltransferase with HDIG domain|nr:HD domain-containing phosphohydrolase [Candidatus Eisenbacteria bacterium]
MITKQRSIRSPRAWASRALWTVVPSFFAALPILIALFGGEELRASRWDWPAIAVWAVLLFAAEALPVPLPRGGTMTIASILDIAALLLFGPWIAAALDLVTTIPAQMLILRNRTGTAALSAGLYASTTIVAGAAYLAAGGHLGAPRFPHDVLPVLLAGSLYYALNTGWVSLVLGSQVREPAVTIWRQQFRDGLAQYALSIGYGLLFAVVCMTAGLPGVLLLVLPLLFARYALRLYADLRQDHVSFVRALSLALDAVDPYTHEHSVRVADYSVRVARRMGLPESEVETVRYAALVHDIGKIAQRPDVIRKPDTLDEEERRLMMRHPEAGARIIGQVRALGDAAKMVRTHHWRPDGRGYPPGLTEADVPVGARVIHVCDAFDAMVSDRPYRKGLPVARALGELTRHAGTQFDVEIVFALVALHEEGRLMTEPDAARADASVDEPDRLEAFAGDLP